MTSPHPAQSDPTPQSELGVLDLEVETARGTTIFDPRTLLVKMATEDLSELPPLPGTTSDISGLPAIVYRTAQVRIQVTPEELRRLVMCSLGPTEMFALLRRHGEFHEIHDDFYDPVSGDARQPKTGARKSWR